MWQALLEEAAIAHGRLLVSHRSNEHLKYTLLFFCCFLVSQEHFFKDKYLFYRFSGDEDRTLTKPSTAEQEECEEQISDVVLTLAQVGPDAMLRMILRKP